MNQRKIFHSDSLSEHLDVLISRLAQKSEKKTLSRYPVYGFRVYILDISEDMRVFCRRHGIKIGYARFMETEFRGGVDTLTVFVKIFFSAVPENEARISYLYDAET